MKENKPRQFRYSWEEAIAILRRDPRHQELIFNSYLTDDLAGNCERFFSSAEFDCVRRLLEQHAPGKRVLDMPAGNGIATYSFARSGYEVVAVDPNPSESVGRGAIQSVLSGAGLHARIVDAYGEDLPFPSGSFDTVYVRQGLHHAADLARMLGEIARVLRPGGILLACREHVVDNYGASLRAFLDSQVDHQLYGGEHAFTLPDYRSAIAASGLIMANEMGPFDSAINMFPNSPESLRERILNSAPGRILRTFMKDQMVADIGFWWARRRSPPGRLYSFLAVKRAA